MRPVLPGDVRAAALALVPVPRAARDRTLATIIERAEAADRFRKRMGRAHPSWGDGTLAAAARAGPVADEPLADDPAYLDAMLLVLTCLADRRGFAPPGLPLSVRDPM